MEQVRSQTTFKEFQPSPYWISDPSSHVLFVDVPGFKRQELMVATKKPGKVIVSGVRPVPGNKYSQFLQEFDAPQHSDFSQISARFDNGVLTIILPRKVTEKTEKPIEKDQSEDEIEEEKKNQKPDKDDEKKHEQGHDLHEERKRKERIEEDNHDQYLYKDKKAERERNGRSEDHGVHKEKKEEKEKWQ